MTRTLIQLASLTLIVLIAAATVRDVVQNGLSGLAVISVGVLVLMGFGVVGALTSRNPNE
jgi:hypothetical protein